MLEEIGLLQVRIFQDGLKIAHRHGRHARGVQQAHPFRGGTGGGELGHAGVETGHVVGAQQGIGEVLVFEEIRIAQHFECGGDTFIGVGNDADIAVLRGKRLTIGIYLPGIADRRRGRVERAAKKMFFIQELREALEHRHFHELAFTRTQFVYHGGQHRVGRVHAGHLVGDSGGHVARPRIAIHAGGETGHAGRGLDYIVIGLQRGVWPAAAEADAMDIDQVGIFGAHRFVAETE